MELQCWMRVQFESAAQRDALLPFLTHDGRPFRDDLAAPAQRLFDVTELCSYAERIDQIGATTLVLNWDCASDIEALQLTSAALSLAARQVTVAGVPDEDGSFCWMAENGELLALELEDDPFADDPLGISCGFSWESLDSAVASGQLVRNVAGVPRRLVRLKKAMQAAAGGAKKTKAKADSWEKRRKALLKTNRSAYRRAFLENADRDRVAYIEKYMLSGAFPAREEDYYVSPIVRLGFAREFDDATARASIDRVIHDDQKAPTTEARVLDELLSLNHEDFCSELGMFEGRERVIARALLPARFDADIWARETGLCSQYNTRFPGPEKVLDWMLRRGFSFLTSPAANPHDPVQDLVDYWRQTLPFLDEISLAGRRFEMLRALMRAVHGFREPRGAGDDDSPVRRFRDRLHAVFSIGTGNVTLDRFWADIATPRERSKRLDLALGIPTRALLYSTSQPLAMRLIHRAFADAGWCDQPFDPEQITLVTLASVVSSQLASALGYLKKEVAPYEAARVAIPAYHYRIQLGTHMTVSQDQNDELGLELFQLIPAPGTAFDPSLPQLLTVPTGTHDDEAVRDTHAALCERLIVRRLERDHGWLLARSDGTHLGRIKAPTLDTSAGSDAYWCLPPYIREQGCHLAEEGLGEPGRRKWHGWPEKTQTEADWVAFKAALA